MAEPRHRVSREVVRMRMARRAMVDPNYRNRLLADPRKAAAEIGAALPESIRVSVIEEHQDELHIVIGAGDGSIEGLSPLWLRIDPAIDRIATAHLESGHARLRTAAEHITDAVSHTSGPVVAADTPIT